MSSQEVNQKYLNKFLKFLNQNNIVKQKESSDVLNKSTDSFYQKLAQISQDNIAKDSHKQVNNKNINTSINSKRVTSSYQAQSSLNFLKHRKKQIISHHHQNQFNLNVLKQMKQKREKNRSKSRGILNQSLNKSISMLSIGQNIFTGLKKQQTNFIPEKLYENLNKSIYNSRSSIKSTFKDIQKSKSYSQLQKFQSILLKHKGNKLKQSNSRNFLQKSKISTNSLNKSNSNYSLIKSSRSKVSNISIKHNLSQSRALILNQISEKLSNSTKVKDLRHNVSNDKTKCQQRHNYQQKHKYQQRPKYQQRHKYKQIPKYQQKQYNKQKIILKHRLDHIQLIINQVKQSNLNNIQQKQHKNILNMLFRQINQLKDCLNYMHNSQAQKLQKSKNNHKNSQTQNAFKQIKQKKFVNQITQKNSIYQKLINLDNSQVRPTTNTQKVVFNYKGNQLDFKPNIRQKSLSKISNRNSTTIRQSRFNQPYQGQSYL